MSFIASDRIVDLYYGDDTFAKSTFPTDKYKFLNVRIITGRESTLARTIYNPTGASATMAQYRVFSQDDLLVGPQTLYPDYATVKVPLPCIEIFTKDDGEVLKMIEDKFSLKLRYNQSSMIVYIFGKGPWLRKGAEYVKTFIFDKWRDQRICQPSFRTALLSEDFDVGFSYFKLSWEDTESTRELKNAWVLGANQKPGVLYHDEDPTFWDRCDGEGYALYAQKDRLIHDIASKLLAYKLEQGPHTKYAIKLDIGKVFYDFPEDEETLDLNHLMTQSLYNSPATADKAKNSVNITNMLFSPQVANLFVAKLAKRLELNGWQRMDSEIELHIARQVRNTFNTYHYRFRVHPGDDDMGRLVLKSVHLNEHLHYQAYLLNGLPKHDFRLEVISSEDVDMELMVKEIRTFENNFAFNFDTQKLEGKHEDFYTDFFWETCHVPEPWVKKPFIIYVNEILDNRGSDYPTVSIEHMGLTAYYQGRATHTASEAMLMLKDLFELGEEIVRLCTVDRGQAISILPGAENQMRGVNVLALPKLSRMNSPMSPPSMSSPSPFSTAHSPRTPERGFAKRVGRFTKGITKAISPTKTFTSTRAPSTRSASSSFSASPSIDNGEGSSSNMAQPPTTATPRRMSSASTSASAPSPATPSSAAPPAMPSNKRLKSSLKTLVEHIQSPQKLFKSGGGNGAEGEGVRQEPLQGEFVPERFLGDQLELEKAESVNIASVKTLMTVYTQRGYGMGSDTPVNVGPQMEM